MGNRLPPERERFKLKQNAVLLYNPRVMSIDSIVLIKVEDKRLYRYID